MFQIDKTRWKDWFKPGSVHQQLGFLLYNFATKEWSTENFDCWFAIQELKGRRVTIPRLPRLGGERQRAFAIYAQWVAENAPNEVNITRALRQEAFKRIQSAGSVTSAFNGVESALELNIKDTLSRFTESKEFARYRDHWELITGAKLGRQLKQLFRFRR